MKENTEIIRISKEVSMAILFVVLLMSTLATNNVFASSSGSSDDSSSSSSSSSDDDRYSYDKSQLPGGSWGAAAYNDVTNFSGGNQGITTYTNNYFAEATGGTVFYSNGDGTYNTITYSSPSSGSSSSCGGSLSCNDDDDPTPSCPAGTSYNYVTGRCEPITCPDGTYLTASNQCLPIGCTSSGKGAPAECRPVTPIPYTPPTTPTPPTPTTSDRLDCILDGVTVPDTQSRVFFSQSSVAYGQTCATVSQRRACTNGNLSGSSAYNRANCGVTARAIPPIVDISASPSIVRAGGSSRITWSSSGADSCSVSGPGLSSRSTSGSQVVNNIRQQATYILTCSKSTAVAQDTARVNIVPLWREF